MMVISKRGLAVLLSSMMLAALLVPASAQAANGSVSGVVASSDAPGVLTVTWDEASPAPSGYRVSWVPVGQPFRSWSDLSGNAYPSAESHTVGGLVAGAEYKVRVRARYFGNSHWSGPWTDEVTVRIQDDPPAAPTELAASSVTHDSVTLTWTAPSSSTVTGYKVFRGTDAESLSVIEGNTGSTATAFTDSSVAAATQYVYSVLALSPDGDGAESGSVTVTTPTDGTESSETNVEDEDSVEVITVTFPQTPAKHDGATDFQMHLDFSHVPDALGWRSLKATLSIEGATTGRVWRRDSGVGRLWGVTVSPDGIGDITITINGTTNCSDQHAVCDANGLMLRGGEQEVILGLLTLSVSEPEVQEQGANLDFVVSLNRVHDQAVTVSYETEDGSATAGSDYTSVSGSLTFDAGQTEKTVSVPVLQNVGNSVRETVVFRLTDPAGAILYNEYALGTIVGLEVTSPQEEVSNQQPQNLDPISLLEANSRTTLVITDGEDGEEVEIPDPPSVSVADALVVEGPGATLDFVVSLSHASDQVVTVTYRTGRGTGEGVALPGSDYDAASGRLTFAAGDTEKTASVRVREDEEEDGRETMPFLLTSAVGATIADAEATGAILNTPKGERRPEYYGHDRPDWKPGQIFPTSVTSTEDHVIDMEWVAPSIYTARKFRVNFAPVDPAFPSYSFPWEGAETGNHWVHYPFATSTRLTGLTGGVEYKVRVQGQYPARGASPAWNGPWSHIMKITPAGDGSPPPPLATASTVSSSTPDQYATGQLTSLKLTTSEVGNILVEWIPPSSPTNDDGPFPPDDYRVSWAKGDESFPSASATAGNADVAGASYLLTGLDSGGTYRVRVRANYPAGALYLQPAWNGPWAELQTVVASPDPDPERTGRVVLLPAVIPEPVVARVPAKYQRGQLATMRLESPESGDIEASWTAPPLPAGQAPSAYQVNWAQDQVPYPDSTASTGYVEVAGTSHTLTGLESGHTYRVRVRAGYQQGLHTAWSGPWTELEIVSAIPELTAPETTIEERGAPAQTRALSTQAQAIASDSVDVGDYISRVWVISQHNLVQFSWRRPTQTVEYRIWRAPAGTAAYTSLAEGSNVTLSLQPNEPLGSRFYFTDTTVTASTRYKYAIQVLENGKYSLPYEVLASTTEWLAPRTRTTAPTPVPRNDDGDYLVEVGEKLEVYIAEAASTESFLVTLEAGEAYRVELNDIVAQNTGAGHSHATPEINGYSPPFVGPITPDPRSGSLNDNGTLEHIHIDSYHMSLSSITQVANGRRISHESQDYRPPTSSNWQVFWDGNRFKAWGDPAQVAHVFHAPAAGDYRVRVRTDAAPAIYALKVAKISDHPNVPSFRSPHKLFTHGNSNWGHSASVLGNIGVDDKDWFAVKLEAGKSYRVALAAGGDLEWQGLTNARLFAMAGPDGVEVQPSFQGASRDRFRLKVPRDEGGYYHFGVSGASASDRGLYVFSIVEDDFPTNPSAPVVGVGQQIIGMIESRGDKDWIGVDLTAGRNYRIKAYGSYGHIGGRVFTYYIGLEPKVFNKNGQQVNVGSAFRMESSDDHGGNVLYIIDQVVSARWTNVATSGRYYFQVNKALDGGERGGSITRNTIGAYYFQVTDIGP